VSSRQRVLNLDCTLKKAKRRRTLVLSPVAVEKLFLAKFAKMKLRQDAF
jgi:hypothetical protein